MSKKNGLELLKVLKKEGQMLSFETDYLSGIFNIDSNVELEDFLHLLKDVISDLLNYDMAALLRILYKLDVDEGLFKKALSHRNPSERVAIVVLERELKRQYFKNMYINRGE